MLKQKELEAGLIKIKEPLQAEHIEWHIKSWTNKDKVAKILIPFITSRGARERLDEAFSGYWSSELYDWKNYTHIAEKYGKTVETPLYSCRCKISIPYLSEDGSKCVLERDDVAESTDIEPIKGEASSAFKRAFYQYGGRDLYEYPKVVLKGKSNELNWISYKVNAVLERITHEYIKDKTQLLDKIEILASNPESTAITKSDKFGGKQPNKQSTPQPKPEQKKQPSAIDKINALKAQKITKGTKDDAWGNAVKLYASLEVNKDISEVSKPLAEYVALVTEGQIINDMNNDELEEVKVKICDLFIKHKLSKA